MEKTIQFLEEEKELIQEQLVDYAKKGNAFGITTANEKLKYINSLINKAIEKLDEEKEQAEPVNEEETE